MIFNSVEFILFFPIVYLLYLILDHKKQNLLLLVASYFFYGYWDWRFLGLILLSTLVDYVASNEIGKNKPATRKIAFWSSIIINLGILGFFKYYNFFINSLASLFSTVGISYSPYVFNIILPLGISFYTFQTMSYTIDVYRGTIKPVSDFFDFALFVSFFPQLVAGPIERATNLIPQVLLPRKITFNDMEEGAYLVLQGFFKKIFVADNMSFIVNPIFAKASPSGFEVLVGSAAFIIQIYGDFSGYSDIARGISRFMGFRLMQNFNLPLLSVNIIDLWARWHISFTTWLRDYVYYPLGGSRVSEARMHFNNILTFFISGLWHGANWTFVIWGVYNGILTSVYKKFFSRKPVDLKSKFRGKNYLAVVFTSISMFVTFMSFAISGIFFRSTTIGQALIFLQNILLNFGEVEGRLLEKVFRLIALLLGVEIYQYIKKDEYAVFKLNMVVRSIIYISMFYGVLILGNFNKNEFIYFVF